MKKLFPLVMLAIFALLFVSCAGNLAKRSTVSEIDSAPAWVKSPLLSVLEDKESVYVVAKFEGKNPSLNRTAATELARKKLSAYVVEKKITNFIEIDLWGTKTGTTYYARARCRK